MKNKFKSKTKIKFLDVIEAVGDAIAIYDKEMNITSINKNFSDIYGVTPEEMLGKNLKEIQKNFKTICFEMIEKTVLTGEKTTKVLFSEKNNIWINQRCIPYVNDEFILIINNLNKEEQNLYINYLNTLDCLTSTGNRFAFEHDIKQALIDNVSFGVMLIDINRFHIINEDLGFNSGDLVLIRVAQELKKRAEKNIKIYRLGVDQFLILGVSSKDIFEKSIKFLLSIFDTCFDVDSKQVMLKTTSSYLHKNKRVVGINITPPLLLKSLEVALFQAKKFKKSILEYSEELGQAKNSFELEKDLRRALLQNEFQLYYQPQCDLISRKVCGAEALIRWQHPEKGFISPVDFLNVAEEVNLMKEIDRWVFEKSILDFNVLKSMNINLALSVNLSSDSLSSDNTVDYFDKNFNKNNMNHNMMTFEITETSIMNDVEKSKENISKLSEKGSKIAIDDFGTGYCSMEYLIKYPSDYLKIDREFVKEISSSEIHKVMVENIIQMGHSLNMKIVAEGVETENEMLLLKEMKCDVIQGYFYAKPMSFENFQNFIKEKGLLF